MGDIGKEAHVHLVDALFLFLLQLGPFCGFPLLDGIHTAKIESPQHQQHSQGIKGICPPGCPGRRINSYQYRSLRKDVVPLRSKCLYLQMIFACRELGKLDSPVGPVLNPTVFEALQAVAVTYAFALCKVRRRI